MPNDPDIAFIKRICGEYMHGAEQNEPVTRYEFGQLLQTLHRILTKMNRSEQKIRRDEPHSKRVKASRPTKVKSKN